MNLVIKPNGNNTYQSSLQELKAIEPPIWQTILATKLKADFIDAEVDNLSDAKILARAQKLNPSKVIILCSGNHPSAYIQQMDNMTRLDLSLTKMGFKVESHSTLFFNPCKVSKIDWNLIDLNKYKAHNWHCFSNNNIRSPYGVLFTSISCPFRCQFCCVKNFYGNRYLERPLEYIYKDLDYFAKNNVVNIKIMDELFVFKKDRVLEICNYIISKGYKFNFWAYARIDIIDKELLLTMKKAGINWLCWGIESGNDEIRKNVLKGSFTKNDVRDVIKLSKDCGMNNLGNFMFGFREDTMETMEETFEFATELNCEFVNFYNVVAYPGSLLHEQLLKEGIKMPTSWSRYAQFSKDFLPISTKTVDYKNVIKIRDESFNKYFTSSNYLNMMKDKFGKEVVDEINKMMNIKIERA